MISQSEIIKLIAENKPFLKNKFGVEKIGIFGSYAKNNFSESSDIDVLIELREQKYDFWVSVKLYLEKLLGKPVDLIATGSHLRKGFLTTINKDIIYV